MNLVKLSIDPMPQPWNKVFDIAGILPADSWLLVGGLMVQAHARLAGLEFRATTDIDMLINVMADNSNIVKVVEGLQGTGFLLQEPSLQESPFHRLKNGHLIVDVLVAEHLPSRKRNVAKVNSWSIMEAPSGSQAFERQMVVVLNLREEERTIHMPDVLGALVLKAAAYGADRRDSFRHLEDSALLASLISDHATELDRLKGSDKKRLRNARDTLKDENNPAWLKLPKELRKNGWDTLRILAG
jgi:predicted nucleotidyltransferase